MMEPPQNIRLLKGIVIGLGVLLFVGLAVVVATIIQRAGRLERPTAAMSVSPAAGVPVAAPVTADVAGIPVVFGAKKLDLPPGSRVVDIRPTSDRLILRLRQVGGNEQLLVLSLVTGEKLGSFDLGAGAATGPGPTQE